MTASRSPPKDWPVLIVAASQPACAEPGDGPGEPRRERAAVGHDIGDPGGGVTVRSIGALDSRQDRGQGRVEIGHDDRHVIDGIRRPEQFMVR